MIAAYVRDAYMTLILDLDWFGVIKPFRPTGKNYTPRAREKYGSYSASHYFLIFETKSETLEFIFSSYPPCLPHLV